MNELQEFIVNKGLEKASIEVLKQAIIEDNNICPQMKEFWISYINGVSIAKDVYDILSILFGGM
jgi:hypothetical protein